MCGSHVTHMTDLCHARIPLLPNNEQQIEFTCVHESYHKYDWVKSRKWPRYVTQQYPSCATTSSRSSYRTCMMNHATRMTELCHASIPFPRNNERQIKSHILTSRTTHMRINKSCHTYHGVTSHNNTLSAPKRTAKWLSHDTQKYLKIRYAEIPNV